MCKNCIKVFITVTAILSICFSFTISSFAGSEIFFYDGTTITQLTDNNRHDWPPQINDSGEVVWAGNDGNDDEIFFYDGTTLTQLTNNDYGDRAPQINNSGDVVWQGTNLDAGGGSGGGGSGGGGGGGGGGWNFGGGGGGCLISTAAYGFRMSKSISTLALLFVSVLIVFHKIRKIFKI